MTNGEVLEMLFRVRMDGQADVDRLAASVRGISGDATIAASSLTSLEKSINALTAEVTANTAALAGMETGFGGVGRAATGAAGGVRSITNELRLMEGGMPIRAAAQFISQIEGISKVMQLAFPVFGAIALFGVVEQIGSGLSKHLGLWGNVTDEEKKATDQLNKYAEAARNSIVQLRGIQGELVTWNEGPAAGAAFRLQNDKGDLSALENAAKHLETQKTAIKRYLRIADTGHGELSLEDQAVMQGVWNNKSWLTTDVGAAQNALHGLDAEQRKTNVAIETQRGVVQLDEAHLAPSSAEVSAKKAGNAAEARKKAAEEAKKRQQELANAEKQAAAYLREAMTFELTGLDRINEKYREKLELLGKTPKAIEDINAAHALEVERETAKENETGAGKLAKLNTWWQEHGNLDAATGGYSLPTDVPKKLQLTGYSEAQQKQDEKDIPAMLKVLLSQDQSDADVVRRSLGVTVRSNKGDGQAGASADYSARVSAAREIFQIETQHLDLIVEKDKRDEAYATARKKRDEEVYRAAEQYENQLQALREQDLKKYESMAGSIFDAMHGHTMNQWFRGFALGQEKQVFQNAVTPILQNAGHAIGGMIPGQDGTVLGTILHGTIFDSKNKGVEDASTTAKQTTRTADEIVKLRTDIRSLSGAPSADSGAPATPDVFNLPMSRTSDASSILFGNGGLLGTGTVPSVGGGSSLFNAGNASKFTQFFSGMSGMGSNPLGAIFGGTSTNGDTETQLTRSQRAGAAVATGAMLVGAGLSIASGISQGGVGGYTKAASAGLGAAAMLDPEPISKTILGSVAAVAGLVGSLFGTGPQQRAAKIGEMLSQNQYLAPTALNVMQGRDGTYEDFDARGNLRTSTMSAVPTVAEPYITSRVINGQRTYYDVAGNVTSPYSGGATGTGVAPIAGGVTNNYIQAMDVASFHEFLQKPANADAVGESLATHLQRHDGRASAEIRKANGN